MELDLAVLVMLAADSVESPFIAVLIEVASAERESSDESTV